MVLGNDITRRVASAVGLFVFDSAAAPDHH
jgi:hypothetical protein